MRILVFGSLSSGGWKAGLQDLSCGLAVHRAHGKISVSEIEHGPFPTWMRRAGGGGGGDTDIDWSGVAKNNPRGRVGTAEDIAGLSIFLCSRAGAFTVGEVITCDGGVAYAT